MFETGDAFIMFLIQYVVWYGSFHILTDNYEIYILVHKRSISYTSISYSNNVYYTLYFQMI